MSKIPTTSQITPSEGIWFVFKDGEREIAVNNSYLAKESVYLSGAEKS
jgi:hypothetical protein